LASRIATRMARVRGSPDGVIGMDEARAHRVCQAVEHAGGCACWQWLWRWDTLKHRQIVGEASGGSTSGTQACRNIDRRQRAAAPRPPSAPMMLWLDRKRPDDVPSAGSCGAAQVIEIAGHLAQDRRTLHRTIVDRTGLSLA
jgi:hypothetical protein